jgi:predicted metalloprotease with PDZ domain
MSNRIAVIVLTALGWFAATTAVSAQSSWQELEAAIRQQRTGTPIPTDSPTVAPAAEDSTAGRAYLGLRADDQNDRGRGVRIMKVTPGGPADQAGLKVDDLITDLGDVRVRAMADMEAVVAQMMPGTTLIVEVLRGQRRHKIPVTFGLRETEPPMAKPSQVSLAAPMAKPQAALPEVSFAPRAEQLPAAPSSLRVPTTPSDAPTELQQLRQRVQELERRVEQLERALTGEK